MRKRSTRLFGILIHLICTRQQYLHPYANLAVLQVHSSESSPTRFLNRMALFEVLHLAPFWLQIRDQEVCLMPNTKFGGCGDTALFQFVPIAEDAYALQLYSYVEDAEDIDNLANQGVDKDEENRKECLVAIGHVLQFVSCTEVLSKQKRRRRRGQQQYYYHWEVDANGIVSIQTDSSENKFYNTAPIMRSKTIADDGSSIQTKNAKSMWEVLTFQSPMNPQVEQQLEEERHCLASQQNGDAVLIPCNNKTETYLSSHQDNKSKNRNNDHDGASFVQFSFVRYTNADTDDISASDDEFYSDDSKKAEADTEEFVTQPLSSSSSSRSKILGSSTVFPMHAVLTPFTNEQTSYLLRQSHPALHIEHRLLTKLDNENIANVSGGNHYPSMDFRIRPEPINPYATEANKDGVYVDPATELTYPIDLCPSLQAADNSIEKCNASSKHLLMGVGQYTRTVFKLKVYGTALYIAQGDIVNNPQVADRLRMYANMTDEEIREDWSFYEILMSPDAGFDRTLVLNLNMQLSCDTMRASLDADWSYLSPEHKAQLNSMTLKPRLANGDMLARISDESTNPSRCSCGQIAPKEYVADTSCCSRGSELAYTWRKNGDLEVRLDGRVMDVFSDVRIGQGIFYEYLRRDDPMSIEARDNFSAGVPNLLYPLLLQNRLYAIESDKLKKGSGPSGKKENNSFQHAHHSITSLPGILQEATQAHIHSAFQYVSNTQEELIDSFVSTSRITFSTMRGIVLDLNEHRERLIEHSLSFLNFHSHESTSDESLNNSISMTQWKGLQHSSPSSTTKLSASARLEHGHISHHRSEVNEHNAVKSSYHQPSVTERLFLRRNGNMIIRVSDEISVMPRKASRMSISPSMPSSSSNPGSENSNSLPHHQIFFAMVHLYLVLLLIVSLPADQSTTIVIRKAKVIASRRRSSKSLLGYDECSDSSVSNISTTSLSSNNHISKQPTISNTTPASCQNTMRMKKSLSYYL